MRNSLWAESCASWAEGTKSKQSINRGGQGDHEELPSLYFASCVAFRLCEVFMRIKQYFTSISILVLSSFLSAQSQPRLNLMPMPASVQSGSGQLPITQSFSVAVTGTHEVSLDAGVQRFTKQLSQLTGIPF